MKICERISCNNVTKNNKTRFCSKHCMYEWRKTNSHITSICNNEQCQTEFIHRKKEPKMFCSDTCMRTSSYIKQKRSQQMLLQNPMHNPIVKEKHLKTMKSDEYREKQRRLSTGRIVSENTKKLLSEIKLQQYSTNGYEILEKRRNTYQSKYGITLSDHLKTITKEYCKIHNISNPFQRLDLVKKSKNRISKGQKSLFDKIQIIFPDAILEHYLSDIRRYVDIFIPSQNMVIEYYGDYWHCNPTKYSKDYFHKVMKSTASKIWYRDKCREDEILSAGYDLEIIWES